MNNEKYSNKLVTIKEKIVTAVKENKKRTIAAALSLILGISVGTTKNISKEEHNNNIKTIAAISEQVNQCNNEYNEIEEHIHKLTATKDELTTKHTTLTTTVSSLKTQIATEESRIASEEKAKAERERLAAEQAAKEEAARIAAEQAAREEVERLAASQNYASSSNGYVATVNEDNIGSMVWITKTGSKYHSHGNCGNSKYVSQVTRESAEARGLDPCSKCY